MKIVYNKLIPFPGFLAINLFGVLFVREENRYIFENSTNYTKKVINHESIHTEQMKEMLYIFFYIWYLIEWLIKCILPPMATAYRDISFEQEAYMNEYDYNYLENRKHYAWLKRVFKSSKSKN